MKLHTASSAIALALGLGVLACDSDTPTSPKMTAPQTNQIDRSGSSARGQTLSFPVSGPISRGTDAAGSFAGTFTVSRFDYNEATQQLMVTGILSGTETFLDGTTAEVANKEVTTTATLKRQTASASTSSPYQFASSIYQFTASCGILLLDLGPLHLDLLGLVVDLNEVILNITAESGANNLLGNLLCALTGLLDIPGAIAAVTNLIQSINNLLGSIGGLATPASSLYLPGGFDISHGAVPILRSA